MSPDLGSDTLGPFALREAEANALLKELKPKKKPAAKKPAKKPKVKK